MEFTPTPLELAYAAGLMDGEGTFGITEIKPGGTRPNGKQCRKSVQHRIYVAVTMTEVSAVTWMYATFGGHFQHLPSRNPKHKETFRWSAASLEAAEFAEVVAPYLKVKQQQAELVAKFYRERMQGNFQGNTGVPEDELALRRAAHAHMKTLNQRGTGV